MKTAEEILKVKMDFFLLNGRYEDFKELHPVHLKAIIYAMNEYADQFRTHPQDSAPNKEQPEDCQSKEDGICRLPAGSCKQCILTR